jgi:flagellar hook-length control protein FliK
MLSNLAPPPFLNAAPTPSAPPPARVPPAHAPGEPAAHPFAKMLRQNQPPPAAPHRAAAAESAAGDAVAEAPADPARQTREAEGSRRGKDEKSATRASASASNAERAGDSAKPVLDESKAVADDQAPVTSTMDPSVMAWLGERPPGADAGTSCNLIEPGDEGPNRGLAAGVDRGRSRGQAVSADAAKGARAAGSREATEASATATTADATSAASEAAPASSTFAESVALHLRGASDEGERGQAASDAGAPAHRIEAIGATPVFSAAAFTPAGSTAHPALRHDITLATPIGAPDFAQALGTQVSVLARDGVQRAELHLHPADMGPVSVQITLDGAQARVDFGADVAATRHVIENGLPELASALRDAGLTLTGGGVSSHARGRDEAGREAASGGRRGASAGSDAEPAAPARQRTVALGGVDLYA